MLAANDGLWRFHGRQRAVGIVIALVFLSMILSENRFPLFGIML